MLHFGLPTPGVGVEQKELIEVLGDIVKVFVGEPPHLFR